EPTRAHLYRLALKGAAEPQPLTKDPGLHAAVFSRDFAVHVHTARLLDAMPVATVRREDGKSIGVLPSVAEEPPLKPDVTLQRVGSGAGFYTAMVRPRAFEPGKRYPVLVDVYGGPHHLHVQASQQRWLLDQWYADQGFIVVSIDGRGTPGRGTDWEREI